MSGDIVVVSRTQVIDVNPATAAVSVINAGPQGPPGEDAFIGGDLSDVVSQLESLSDSFALHVSSDPTPHPVYDDMPSIVLIFENHLI